MNLLKDLLSDWFISSFQLTDYVLLAVVWVVNLFVIALITLASYFIWDAATIERGQLISKAQAIITARSYTEPYTTTTMVLSEKVMVPMIISHPATYKNSIIIKGETVQVDNKEVFYWDTKKVLVDYYDCKRFGKHVRYEIENITKR